MKKNHVALFGLVLVVGSMIGCTSRTKVTVGPVQIAGKVQIYRIPHTASFDLSLNKIGFTIGQFGCGVESSFGPFDKVIGIEHSIKAFADTSVLGNDSE